MPTDTSTTSADVIIIGAGLAGAAAATLLARQGVRVLLVDARATYPPAFKAEKIEPDQGKLFRKFGLMEALLPFTGRIHEIVPVRDGDVMKPAPIEQYGIFYHDMVNAVRSTIPPTVDFKIGRVKDIRTSSDVQRVTLADGAEYTARLVAVACGTGGDLHARLGLRKKMIQREQSLAFGFTIARPDGQPFPFDAVTYYPESCVTGVGYLSLFLIGTAMRANLFVFWPARDERVRSFVRQPRQDLPDWLPHLTRVIGEFEVVTKVETGRIDLFRAEGFLQPGLVLLADAFQSVCPVTGTGLTKVLTDVDVFCHDCVPQWLSTPGMGVEKIAGFYRNPRKQKVDRHSLRRARNERRLSTDDSLPWRAYRAAHRWWRRLSAERTGGPASRLTVARPVDRPARFGSGPASCPTGVPGNARR